jgi:hypothetical protein
MNSPLSSQSPSGHNPDGAGKSLVGVADKKFTHRIKLCVVIAMLAAAVVVIVSALIQPPTESAVVSYVRTLMSQQGQEPENVYVTNTSHEGGSLKYSVSASLKVSPENRYTEVLSEDQQRQMESLPDWFTLDRSSWMRCQKLISSPNGVRLRQLASLTPREESLLRAVLLRQVSSFGDANDRIAFTGVVTAEHRIWNWHLSWTPEKKENLSGSEQTIGRKLSEFTGEVYLLDRPSDREKLIELAQSIPGLRERLEKAATSLVAEKRASYLQMLKPKVLFAGTASTKTPSVRVGQKNPRIFLEVTEVRDEDGSVQLTAVVRNDGSWSDARIFTGELVCGDDGLPVLSLNSSVGDAISEAGPFLQLGYENYDLEIENGNSLLPLRLEDRVLVYENKNISLRLEPLTEEQRAAEIAAISSQGIKTLEAVQNGHLYKGTVTHRATGIVETWAMRFSAQEDNTHTMEMGRLDNPDEKVGFTVSVITNHYRAANTPIRLDGFEGYPSDDVAEMRELPPFDLLVAEGGKLRGENSKFVFRFEPTTTDALPQKENVSSPRKKGNH